MKKRVENMNGFLLHRSSRLAKNPFKFLTRYFIFVFWFLWAVLFDSCVALQGQVAPAESLNAIRKHSSQ